MGSSSNRITMIHELDPRRTAIIFGPLSALLISPIIFRMVKLIEQESSLKSDLIALVITTLSCVIFMALINNYLRCLHCQAINKDNLIRSYQQRSVFHKLFSTFIVDTRASSAATATNQDSSFSYFHSIDDQQSAGNKKKIDPKYFKPKFIFTELMTFWDTTCTVITWGSFYLIGGTIVATERIAQKIKAKRTNSREGSFNTSYTSNRGTGYNDSFMSVMSPTSDSGDVAPPAEPSNPMHTFRRISSWTKRSLTSMRKRFSRAVSSR